MSKNNFLFRKIKASNSGFKSASLLVPELTQKAFEKRGFSQSRLITKWDEVVGPALSQVSKPIKISFSKSDLDATLTVEIEGAYGPEIDMQKDIIKEKVNRFYGYTAVTKIKLRSSPVLGYHNSEENELSVDRKDKKTEANEIGIEKKVASKIILSVKNVKNKKLRGNLENLATNFLKK